MRFFFDDFTLGPLDFRFEVFDIFPKLLDRIIIERLQDFLLCARVKLIVKHGRQNRPRAPERQPIKAMKLLKNGAFL